MFNLESHVWTADIPCSSITANNIFLNFIIMALSAYVAEDILVIPQWEERLYVGSMPYCSQTVLRNRYHSQAITLGKASGPLKVFLSSFIVYNILGILFLFV